LSLVVVAAAAMVAEKVHRHLLGHLGGLRVHQKKQESLWMMPSFWKGVKRIVLQSFPF
jgi:hypothetical protein